jgi:hypothetical protein
MGDKLCFNNNLSLLKSVTTLIVPFFYDIANDGNKEAHSEEKSSSRIPMSPILQFPCSVTIVVPLIWEQCKHAHELVYN